MTMTINPIQAFLHANRLLLTGRLRFSRARLGERVTPPDGRSYTIFRQATVSPAGGQPDRAGVVFEVQFHPAGMSAAANKWFSLLPMPFCVGCPGFRSKLWAVNESTGECAGIYEWDTPQDAEAYAASFAMRFSKGRSRPGTFSYRITPGEAAR